MHARACYRIPFSCRPVRAGNHETRPRLAARLQPVKPHRQCSTIVFPIPLLAPVTTATLPQGLRTRNAFSLIA